MKPFLRINVLLTAGVALTSLIVVVLLGQSIRTSRIEYDDDAKVSSQNLAQVLNEDIMGIIDRVDLIVLTVTDEAEKQIRLGGIQPSAINAYIVRHVNRVPELDSLRMADAQGDILYGPGVVPGVNIADRDYFYLQRDDSIPGAAISKPYLSRTTGKWQISISRRISRPDGSFAGIAYGNFTLDYFTKMFSGINVGSHGAIALWNSDLELIARYPEPAAGGHVPGMKLRSANFNSALLISKEGGSYITASGVDKIERRFSYHKISRYPLYILVGMATQDYLKEWRREAIKKSAFAMMFLALSFSFWFLLYRHLSESRRAAAQLKASEERFRAFMDNSPSIAWAKDEQGRYVYLNRSFEKRFGVLPDDWLGKTDFEVWPEEIAGAFSESDRAVVAGGHAVKFVEETANQDGSRCLWWNFKFPFQDIYGRRYVGGIGIDITDQMRTEEALVRQKAFLQRVIDTDPNFIFVKDRASRFVLVNKAVADAYGSTVENLIGKSDEDFNADEKEVEHFHRDDLEVIDGRQEKFIPEERITTATGEIRWLQTIKKPLMDEDGVVRHLLGVSSNITQRKKSEKELKENEERYRLLFETARDGIFILGKQGYIECNQIGADMYGLAREELVGRQPLELSPEKQPDGKFSSDVAGKFIREALNGIPRIFEWQSMRADGSLFDVEITLGRIELGGEMYLQAIVRDITERKRMEQEILKAQKLESIGTLAGGIAHDFNNLLQGIFGYISMARMSLDRPEKANAMLKQTEEALHTAVNLTTQLLTFSKGGKPVKKLIRLESVVENSLRFALSGSKSDYKLSVAEGLWAVEADDGQLSQVIQNIVLNANEAMAQSGTVYVSLSNVDNSSSARRGLPEGSSFVCVDILDTGIGIPKDNIQKIFDPYFTTKQKGSGLGLATSYSIIRNHGGMIEVKSEISEGSTFSICLPAVKDSGITKELLARQPSSSRKVRVLLMDDEEMIRNVATAMVTSLGHEIECVNDGGAAVEAYRKAKEAGSPYDIVILDLTVKGGMGGEEAIRILRQVDPGIVAVVSSGYADSPVAAKYKDFGFTAFLNKPYTLDGLKNCIDSLI